ncbi:expressed unknown protein [Seminavis robusta]|uniref:Ethylene receptor 1-like N-terminal domain-containing protein n=1 Tax=Seminavis robusta TaxID=568900 RepID=A0A9N8HA89_9STRA|nr:expressed unknown protein [Seminavis robusta]|eukprot:Sro310_g114040.1 n/a (128) ;mRNA; f:33819-34202
MRVEDLIISIAYFSIPLQLVASLTFYPRLMSMPPQILFLFVLFALFILCCGTGHVLRCVNMTDTHAFHVVNWITAFVSITTALFLLPMVPTLMSEIDDGLQRLQKLEEEAVKGAKYSKLSMEHSEGV